MLQESEEFLSVGITTEIDLGIAFGALNVTNVTF